MKYRNDRRCDGVNRRDALCIGSLTGLGIGLANFFRGQATAIEPPMARAKSCIL